MSRRVMIVAVLAACSRTQRQPSHHRTAELQGLGCSIPGEGRADPEAPGCKADAECTAGQNGRCNVRGGGHDPKHDDCEYQKCRIDADCGATAVCECGNTGSYCLEGGCRSDDNCSGAACSPTSGCRGGTGGYYCHTAEDSCVDNSGCHSPNAYCAYQPEVGHWACVDLHCPVG